ncbi:hypothetical protein GGI20_002860 [Coemansia sp. BCRC 34301]|nr:hypothetical protein GGI20_002860 [Coemansia sp. BCRC 34301]
MPNHRLPSDPSNNMYRLAQELTIDVFGKGIYSGEAVGQLSSARYDGCAFPLVRKLEIDIFMATADKPNGPAEADESAFLDPLEIGANIGSFVQRLKEMAPKVSDIVVTARGTETCQCF